MVGSITPQQAARQVARWRDDPSLWVRDVLSGVNLWSKQLEILDSVRVNRETTVYSANSCGKSMVAAVASLWWLFTRPDSIVVVTANSSRQVQDIVGGEVRRLYYGARIPLGGVLAPAALDLKLSPKHFMTGVTASTAGAFQGYHSASVLVIQDEASDLAEWVDAACLGCAVTNDSRILRIGNPLSPAGHPFTRAAQAVDVPGKSRVIRINALESPNVVAGREVIRGLMTLDGVEAIKRKYGEGSKVYRARVLGLFSAGAADSLITAEDVLVARGRLASAVVVPTTPVHIGCDVARYGDDMTMTCVRQGAVAWFPEQGRLQGADGVEVARRLARVADDYGAETVSIDGGGLGAGPIDALRDLQRRGEFRRSCEVIEVQFGAGASDAEQFLNRRAELWWKMREWLRTEAAFNVSEELLEELTAPAYEIRGARIKLEEKEAVKRRLRRSPDMADALALAVSGCQDPVGGAEVFFVG